MDTPTPLGRFRRPAELLLLAGSAFFVFKALAQGWPAVSSRLGKADPLLLAAAWLAYLAYFCLRAAAWRAILRPLGTELSAGAAARTWFLSEFSRYVPGSVWSFLARVSLAEKQGVPKRITAVSLGLEVILLILASAAFAIPFLLLGPLPAAAWTPWLSLLLIPAALLALRPGLASSILTRLARRFSKGSAEISLPAAGLAGPLAVLAGAWLAYGLACCLVLAAFLPTGFPWIWTLSAFVIAWLAGYLSVVTPMGLGVREGVLLVFLSPVLGAPLAGLAAVATRLWLTLSELSVLALLGIAARIDRK